ncbi:hypothetical protein [Gordonia sp. 852002-10350_SCH5691597]|uniref:hypothetical protein n=1 Tax=Gordonia sp. 852002-10350_SCH5691597 TaxID=1834085 RepID=UPI0007E938FE|nr:hypothetical protein [Gordonia sp. 852002-10350_SCH5691597]OBA67771.1 hypothetical protein A5777_16480 [Gordonia sp. 852002-10350_SCH5691597]
MGTESARHDEVDAARVNEIKRLLDQPGGGPEAVAKQFGKVELGSDEYKTAQQQRRAAVARRQQAAEARERNARQNRSLHARDRRRAEGGQDKVSTAELRDRLKQGQKDLRAADQESARAKDLGRDRVRAR